MKLKIKKLNPNAIIPTYGSQYSAGCDLYACLENEITIEPHTTVKIPTGIALEIPCDMVGLVYARSGLASKRDLAPANKVGVIDSDYRGEIIVALHNHGNHPQVVGKGERIAQLVFTHYYQAEFIESDELSETVRGAGGFGSTGSK